MEADDQDPGVPSDCGPYLVFDTSGASALVGVVAAGRAIMHHEEMARQHTERLMPLIEATLAEAGVAYSDLMRIGVGIGPGSFAGIRIAVSAARGLALSLGVRCLGISGFDRIHHARGEARYGAILAPRDQVYLAALEGPGPPRAPRLVSRDEVRPSDGSVVFDSDLSPHQHIRALFALTRAGDPSQPAKPLYVREADATPPPTRAPHIVP